MDEQHSPLGRLIIESMQEVLAHARGEDIPARVTTVQVTARKAHLEPPPWYPPHLIREIRHRLSVSQAIFAQMLGVSASTVRAWEQGKREPEGPARRLLQVADLHMDVFWQTCGDVHPGAPGVRPLPRVVNASPPRQERLAADTDAS
ncbi:helix-turn-helix domain-containing protein [Longimicrobium sp.]|uniref:helix-turn-helix domain-containing protein n=1 Tax=Longimicrobium sp. TaxID=2029185 RepID=UPI002E312CF4|nr:helix-turn-helix domain-containing protein [Longimicrobium sp.]HEX6037143.1 helix-turn-helix domain-containing protein [Longimicrobium sp.]